MRRALGWCGRARRKRSRLNTQKARHIQTYSTVTGNGAEGINLDEDGYDADPMDGFDDGTIFPTQTQVGGATLQYVGYFVCIWTLTKGEILA